MPELPEVETVRRGLEPVMRGRRILGVEQRRADLRWPFPERFAERLTGRRVETLGRRAKYLVASLDDGHTLLMHLGMSGRFRVDGPQGAEEPGAFYDDTPRDARHDHVVFTLEDGFRVTYNDARRFGFMALLRPGDNASPLAGLGIEPLGEALTGPHLAGLLATRATSIKAALLDQRLVAGLGNIYVCEALHRSGIAPTRAAKTLSQAETVRLAAAIRAVLEAAVTLGGSTLRDHRATDGAPGRFQERFAVYDRAGTPCPTDGCEGAVIRLVQSGRSTFHCPHCQV